MACLMSLNAFKVVSFQLRGVLGLAAVNNELSGLSMSAQCGINL